VLPNGTIQTVTSQNEDLWFALRVSDTITLMRSVLHAELIRREALTTLYAGSHPDFLFILQFGSPSYQGIVTKFVLQAHPQGDVWVIISYFWETRTF
jgi:hypothetical protein